MPLPSYSAAADRVTDRLVLTIKRAERVAASSTGAVSGLTWRIVAARGPRLLVKADLAGRLPSVHDLAATHFKAAERVLEAQKQYALTVISAASRRTLPVAAPSSRSVPEAVPPTETKRVVRARPASARTARKKPAAE